VLANLAGVALVAGQAGVLAAGQPEDVPAARPEAVLAGQAGPCRRRPAGGDRAASARQRALAGLAPRLPDADRPAIVAQALAAATAITTDHSRAEALTGLAPHLPADLLAQALGSAPRTAPQALMALLERGQALHTQGSRLAYVRLLRDCLNGINGRQGHRIFADRSYQPPLLGSH
jgi:hypothetical protein